MLFLMLYFFQLYPTWREYDGICPAIRSEDDGSQWQKTLSQLAHNNYISKSISL